MCPCMRAHSAGDAGDHGINWVEPATRSHVIGSPQQECPVGGVVTLLHIPATGHPEKAPRPADPGRRRHTLRGRPAAGCDQQPPPSSASRGIV